MPITMDSVMNRQFSSMNKLISGIKRVQGFVDTWKNE
jgi:hypothetical protein